MDSDSVSIRRLIGVKKATNAGLATIRCVVC